MTEAETLRADTDVAPLAAPAPLSVRVPLYDRSMPLFAAFFLLGTICLVVAYASVYSSHGEQLGANPNAGRARAVVSHWMNEGYFHYAGLMVRHPTDVIVYRTSTGAYMVSLLVVQRFYSAVAGHYSFRLAALHNVFVSVLLASLAGLLTFRLTRRVGLPPRLAFVAGAAVVVLLFTFPDNLSLYWEMTAQVYWAVFAILFLILHERCADGRRTRSLTIAQAASAFVMTLMEPISALAFIASFGAAVLMLEQQPGEWKRFALLAVLPFIAAMALFAVQRKVAAARFPEEAFTGSGGLFRSGLDGESLYYGDHLDIAFRRDHARLNWPANRDYLFRWKWVFLLGTIATLAIIAAYIAGRVPRLLVEVLAAMTGAWLLYAAVFSQSFVIHPYLYDVMLYIPLVIALFALLPALAESLTRRTGAIILVAVFCASWYAMFQMRLYALRDPAPGAKAAPPAATP
jgi:hypothetical protein